MSFGLRSSALVAALAFVLGAPELATQTIRGAIFPADPGRPLAGELITVTDERSRFVAHGSTDLDGEFAIEVQRAGAYRVQWQQRVGGTSVEERIGVSMYETRPIALREGGKAVSYRPFMDVADACRRSGFREPGEATAAEAAMRALLAAMTVRAADSLVVDVVQYDLERMAGDATLRVLSVNEGRAAAGAVLDVLIPGASASLEPEWRLKICPSSPVTLRADHDPIAVTIASLTADTVAQPTVAWLWIDRRSGAIGGVTPVDRSRSAPKPEAFVDLAVLPTGHVILRRWRLAVPVDSAGGERLRGGELAAIAVRGLPRWSLSIATVRVRLAPASRALRGASLAILDGGPIADFDADGNASIAVGVEGAYLIEVVAPELASIGVSPTIALGNARVDAGAPDTISLPLPADLRSAACGYSRDDPAGVLVRFQSALRASATRPASLRLRPASSGTGAMSSATDVQALAVNSEGRAIWCVRRSSGTWTVEVGDGPNARTQLVRMPEWALDTAITIGLAEDGVAGQATAPLRSNLRVIVVDSSGARLPGVSIRLHDSTGVRIDGRIGSDGTATFGDVSTEPMLIEARALGFAPSSATIRLDVGENEVRMILHRNLVVQLDPVYVRELPSLLSRHGEFERRRRYGFAAAMYTAEQIHRRNPVDVWQMFQTTPGLRLKKEGGSVYAVSSRGAIVARQSASSACAMRVAVDGAFLIHPADIAQLPTPDEIYGIEVYAGPATIPLEYRRVDGSNCGIILVWTK